MAAEDAINVGQALDNLVHQFSDPWSFLRELMQNAIDAGSREIEVRIEHEPPADDDPGPGLMLIEIIDSGEGMDREIIDTRLTRLFSSAKDGDYTKIGRFGIGFVSVFAIEPDLVCVDTGRAGEYWRVLFRADRSFERIVLDMPVEGTTIRIYKHGDEDAVAAARVRAAEILEYWCKHAQVEIRLDDEPISRALDLDARCVIEHEEEGTRVLLGLVPEAQALRGYYHGGLTLHEEHDARLPHVAFKIDSRYLEHTLTRDNVIRDQNYDKAMAIVAKLAATKLVAALFEALAEHTATVTATAAAPPPERSDPLLRLLRERAADFLTREQAGELKLDPRLWQLPIIPRIGAPPCSLAECRKQRGGWWLAPSPSPTCGALHRDGQLVVAAGHRDTALQNLLILATGKSPQLVESLCTATPASAGEAQQWRGLAAALKHLLEGQGVKLSAIELGHLAYPDSPVAEHVAITQGKFGELTPVAEIGQLSKGWLASKRVVVVNADHPTVVHLLQIATREPEFAAYLLLKLFYLRSELPAELDGALATAAAEARWQRSTS
ncbi:MAG: ATP-binding protein [Myxococcales bacterium]|nr:ATP-binding protein [Myxococcales bacterium]